MPVRRFTDRFKTLGCKGSGFFGLLFLTALELLKPFSWQHLLSRRMLETRVWYEILGDEILTPYLGELGAGFVRSSGRSGAETLPLTL